MPAELRFRVMGTDAHVVVVGGDEGALARWARRRLDDLERRWSRFLDHSEISRLNRRPGRPVVVSPETFRLVATAISAWHATGGLFDPTVLHAVRDAGYDRDFDLIAPGPVAPDPSPPGPVPGGGGIRLDPALPAVWLPPGTGFDPGGIGKGLAADMVSEELRRAGARGALVNVGGDLRAAGEAPGGGDWVVSVDDPTGSGRELARFALADGAVATSSRLRRRWPTAAGERHHLIDPRTGAPTTSPVAAVTVVAAEGWWAEALATAICVAPSPAAVADRDDASVLIVGADGSTTATGELAGVLV